MIFVFYKKQKKKNDNNEQIRREILPEAWKIVENLYAIMSEYYVDVISRGRALYLVAGLGFQKLEKPEASLNHRPPTY